MSAGDEKGPPPNRHPLAIDLLDLIEELPMEHHLMLAHIATCVPCRLGLVNIIQSHPDYPDLYADPENTRYWSTQPAGPQSTGDAA